MVGLYSELPMVFTPYQEEEKYEHTYIYIECRMYMYIRG